MAETPYNHYALYEPDAAPDLTATGEYNSAVMQIDADIHAERQARAEADTALNVAIANEAAQRKSADDALDTAYKAADAALGGRIDTEAAQRKSADDALGKRIDNAEVEISANSADLTGIKGLTYGDSHVNFIEHSNGEYSSPALEEIAEQISQGLMVIEITSSTTSVGANTLTKLKESWPNVMVLVTDAFASVNSSGPMFPVTIDNTRGYAFSGIRAHSRSSDGALIASAVTINATGDGKVTHIGLHQDEPDWHQLRNKPFSTIGQGLTVVNNALAVNSKELGVVTASTTWGELESAIAEP